MAKDRSIKVHQRDKIKSNLTINELQWTPKQLEFLKIALDKKTRIMLVSGSAGTGKTAISVYCALKLLNDKKISDILYIRSPVESADHSLGYLPGTIDDKLHYYNLPLLDKLDEFLPKPEIDILIKEKRVLAHPLGFCRGMSWNAKFIINDESQGNSLKELITVLTRIGKFSKCFLLADPLQSDLPKHKQGGFEALWKAFDNEESRQQGIYTFEFTDEDIMRDEIVKYIIKKVKPLTEKS